MPFVERALGDPGNVDAVYFNRDRAAGARHVVRRNRHAPVEVSVRPEFGDGAASGSDAHSGRRVEVAER